VNESGLKTKLVAQIKQAGGYAQRFEDKFSVGLLDMGIQFPGLNFAFAEAKLVSGNVFGPTPAQFAKGKKWIDVGTLCILIGWKKGAMLLSPWVERADIADCWNSADILLSQVVVLREFISDRQTVQELRPFRRPRRPVAGDLQAPEE
jgi:hypothetical protein